MHASLGSIKAWEAEFVDEKAKSVWGCPESEIEALFSDTMGNAKSGRYQDTSRQLVEQMVTTCLDTFPEVCEAIGFPDRYHQVREMTPFELASTVYLRWGTKAEFKNEVNQQSRHVQPESIRDYIWFCALAIQYQFNIILQPEYRALFVNEVIDDRSSHTAAGYV